MLATVLALGSAAFWGTSDFLGGLESRRNRALTVVLVSQAVGMVALGAVVVVGDYGRPPTYDLLYAVLAGLAGATALTVFFRALAVGKMGVVAPISATAVVVPIAFGLIFYSERPSSVQTVGTVLAIAGVVLVTRKFSDHAEGETDYLRHSVLLALLAALGFGIFFVAIDRASEQSVLWALFVERIAAVGLLTTVAAAATPKPWPRKGSLPVLLGIGCLDLFANFSYAVATTRGELSTVSVLGSCYPVTTVLLARVVLKERLARSQLTGVLFILVGVIGIST